MKAAHISGCYYPCLCLCLGFSHRTLNTPFLLTILHFEQIAFTDGLTFISHPPQNTGQRYAQCSSSNNYYLNLYVMRPFVRS